MAKQPTENFHVVIAHRRGTGPNRTTVRDIPIPPDYDNADIRAFAAHEIEGTTWKHLVDYYNRRPSLAALIAHAARIRAIRAAVNEHTEDSELRDQIIEELEKTNAQITAEWGEEPDADQG